MAQYIRGTFQALASGDISRFDACYSLSAHLISAFVVPAQKATSELEVQSFMRGIVDGVADDLLTEHYAAAYLITVKEKLGAGKPFADIIAGMPLISSHKIEFKH